MPGAPVLLGSPLRAAWRGLALWAPGRLFPPPVERGSGPGIVSCATCAWSSASMGAIARSSAVAGTGVFASPALAARRRCSLIPAPSVRPSSAAGRGTASGISCATERPTPGHPESNDSSAQASFLPCGAACELACGNSAISVVFAALGLVSGGWMGRLRDRRIASGSVTEGTLGLLVKAAE